MKSLAFDSGPIINLAMNNILWLLEPLENKFDGKFYIGKKVKEELIDYPLKKTKKFRFEALQTLKLVDKKIINIYPKKHIRLESELLRLFNSVFLINGRNLNVVHGGEVEAVAIAIRSRADALVIDERTTRLILENPKVMAKIFSRRLHAKIKINNNSLKKIKSLTKGLKMIRSVELVVYAYEQGLLNKYLPSSLRNPKKTLLEAVVWGIKLHGCSMTIKEINEIKKIESKR